MNVVDTVAKQVMERMLHTQNAKICAQHSSIDANIVTKTATLMIFAAVGTATNLLKQAKTQITLLTSGNVKEQFLTHSALLAHLKSMVIDAH